MNEVQVIKGRSLWKDALTRLKKNKVAMRNLAIIGFYALVAVLAKMEFIGSPWDSVVGSSYQAPSFEKLSLICGTDIFGRSVFYKVIHGTRIAMSVGLVSALISIPVGIFFGSIAGYFGGWIDEIVVWIYSSLYAIPGILLLLGIAFVMGKGMTAVYVALSATAWIGLARVIRGEFIKHKSRDYVVAAQSLGATHFSRIFRHILPNVFHFVIIHFTIQFVVAIKAEVILSFLGVGVQGQPSWGIMIDDAKLELARGVWWQLTAATVAMFFVVRSLNRFGDELRDALDPKFRSD